MKFSVIIPLYNKAPYIRKALASVIAQTYTDYELIIVDDGSTDDSAKIAEEFISSSFPLGRAGVGFYRQANAGVSAARNNGVAHAKGDYLAFLDADDWWEPTYLERMAQLINDYPDAGLYASNYVYYKPGKTHVAIKNVPTGYINYPKTYYKAGAMPVWTGATIISRTIFDEMGGFVLGVRLGEDFILWANIAMHYSVAFLNEPLSWYNNDVPIVMRATRNIHRPEQNMLFRLDMVDNLLDADGNIKEDDWRLLLDRLRVNCLLDYWLSDEYHDIAAQELMKVDWSEQPQSKIWMYKIPISLLRLRQSIMMYGSYAKQYLVRLLNIYRFYKV